MRKSLCGSGEDSDAVQVLMDAILAAGAQVVSVTDGGHLSMPRFHVFGIAEDNSMIAKIRDMIIKDSKKKGISFQERS